MSPKRGDRAAPPAGPGEWEVRFGTNDAAKGWDELCRQAAGNTRRCWELMRAEPAPTPQSSRHHQLKGSLALGMHHGRSLPCWQIEVTGGGRIWYLIDADYRTVWITYAGVAHPRATD